MANMTFYRTNAINTTSAITVSTGTASSAALIDRDDTVIYTSSGDNSDTTTTTVRIEFSAAQNLSCISLQNINLRGFKVYYNSNSANTITLTNGDTTTSVWNSNSATAIMMCFSTISASIITLEATTTIIANSEKKIGEMWCLNKYHTFERNPDSGEYSPKKARKQYQHEMSDGGIAVYVIQDNFACDIARKFVDPTEYLALHGMYTLYTPVVFAPEPTGSGWNGQIWEVNWLGDFEFLKYTQNYKSLGYTGKMQLRETPK